jgi:hypothetical protein
MSISYVKDRIIGLLALFVLAVPCSYGQGNVNQLWFEDPNARYRFCSGKSSGLIARI